MRACGGIISSSYTHTHIHTHTYLKVMATYQGIRWSYNAIHTYIPHTCTPHTHTPRIHINTHTHIRIYIYIYTHTQTHTYPSLVTTHQGAILQCHTHIYIPHIHINTHTHTHIPELGDNTSRGDLGLLIEDWFDLLVSWPCVFMYGCICINACIVWYTSYKETISWPCVCLHICVFEYVYKCMYSSMHTLLVHTYTWDVNVRLRIENEFDPVVNFPHAFAWWYMYIRIHEDVNLRLRIENEFNPVVRLSHTLACMYTCRCVYKFHVYIVQKWTSFWCLSVYASSHTHTHTNKAVCILITHVHTL